MRAALYLLSAATFVYAQDKKPVFDTPDQEPKTSERKEERVEDQIQRTLGRLSGWPNARARSAAERLIVQKEKSLSAVIAVLVSANPEHVRLKPGAAYVVGRIGDKSHFLTLLLVASEKAQQKHAATFLEAAWRLDQDAAVAEAFRFFHLSETTLRRESTKFVLNRVTEKNLPAIFDLLDRRKAERPFTREIGLRLLDRLVQTRQVQWSVKDADGRDTGAGQRFYRALGDESPQVSSRAMRLLSARNDPQNVVELNRRITDRLSYWRQRSYAALSLAMLAGIFKEQPFTPEAIATLKGPRGLRHPKETLARASSALALAQVALRTNDKELVRLLDREIPILLIDASGASKHHYRDFGTVMPLAFTMLRRITGQTFPDHAPVWAKWWQDNQSHFRAKRELIEVEKPDLQDVVVELTQPRAKGAERVRVTVVGTSRPTYLHGRAYALPRAEMDALLELLRESRFFTSPEADPAELDEESALVVVRVGDLDRKVTYGAGDDTRAVRDRILLRIDGLIRAYAWQLWWDIDKQPSWSLFFAEQRKWFRDHPDERQRADRMRAMVAGSLNDLIEVQDRMYAVRYLASLPGGGSALDEAEVKALIDAVLAERAANEFVSATVDLLVPGAGAKAEGALIDALDEKIGPQAQALLVRLCQSLALPDLARLAGDERWKVRRAVVLAVSERGAEKARPILAQRLTDDEVLVRVAACEVLARWKDASVLSALGELKRSNSPEVRGTTAYAYGLLASREGREGVRNLLYTDRNPDVRVRAIRGLVDGGDPAAADMILEIFKGETDVSVRAAAATGVVALETPALVNRLIDRLQVTDALDPERVALVNVLARFRSERPLPILRSVVQGDDRLSADAAALGLARRWEDAALFQLISMVKRGGTNARVAVRHLQILTSTAFESESYRRQGENYAGWARTNSEGNPRSWFLAALMERGYTTTSLTTYVADAKKPLSAVPDAAIPLLLRVLRDRDWHMQRNASFLLSQRIGTDAPAPITYSTSRPEAEKAISAYNAWWRKEQEKKRAKEKG